MPTLSEYTNVYNTALSVIKKKGYRFWFDKKLDAYFAEKDGWDFMANNPCGLLGIICIFEDRSPSKYCEYWWRDDGEDLFGKISKRRPSYVPIYLKKDE